MRPPVLVAVAACLVAACGGAVDAAGTSTDAGTSDAATDSSAPNDAAPEAVPDVAPSCGTGDGFVSAMKACHGNDDCTVQLHTVDCCGSTEWVGVTKSDSAAWLTCESAWASSLAMCDCMPGPTTTEDGVEVADEAAVTVECTYWTMSGGVCMTRAAAPDAGPDGGASAGVTCGGAVCTPGGMCCVLGGGSEEQCVPKDAVGPKCDFSATCDGPEDCAPGESCCGPSGGKLQSYCATFACPAGDTLCHTPSDCGGAAPACCPAKDFGWEHSVCAKGACP